ncbi:hypothetical protein IQ266_19310 [filamentous cyanobacterium LEGE 11480]|uniref:Uncharacterized protein n=1 Tax=Romeriopsis navalis LEGE 11480 TaxID=2777977 RepID=A0A928VQH7_9CYAN|nr:hypothetical protein [Romeriopsis navalis]MBE9031887.1 hypothetical protein [Romeriopsis navalis LEGE 11480]
MMMQFLRGLTAWSLVILGGVQVWRMFTEGTAHARRLHQIPCPGCQYFSGDYTLKCALHPSQAGTEDAIDCMDFWGRT